MSQPRSTAETVHPPITPIPNPSPVHLTAVTANQLLPGWIRRRRKSLDLTQADLADRLACSISTVQKVEDGERRPSKHLAANLLDALEIPEGERPVFMRLARGKSAPRNEPTRPADPHSATGNTSAPNNTPFPTSALVGREIEAAWGQDLLVGDDARLVTLTGLPGVGKTRLAQHMAHAAQFEDGVCYVSLAAVPPQPSPHLACTAVAAAICKSLRLEPATPDALIAHLRELHLLLVLDTFEHLLAAHDLLVRLLQETRWVKLLVTSHERLRLRAEHAVPLAGLPIGQDSPALQLFLARASRVAGPAFAKTNALQKMVRICHLVDGLPLGIEMACELTATQSLAEIGDAIERDMGVLHTTSPDVPEAQRSLRGLFTSVWQKLSADEQCVIAQCTAFLESFSLEEASQAIRFDEEPKTDCARLRAMLDALVEKSVLRRIVDETEQGQRGQYLLHPLLRQVAAQPPTPKSLSQ